MKKLFTFLTFLMSTFIFAQTTTIIDPNFEQALLDLGYDDVIDGSILTANINTVTNLNVSNKNIASLTGIEDFISLTNLNCDSNQIQSIDITQNVNLNGLSARFNQISSIDVTQNILLTFLNLQSNQLNSIDVTQNTALTYLGILNNQISNVNLSQNLNLVTLSCQNNQLNTLDITQNIQLTHLECSSNQLQNIDVSNNINLTFMALVGNQFTAIDLSQNSLLEAFYCSFNQITTLDLSNQTNLVNLSCNDNNLTSLNVKNGNNVNFSGFDATNNPNLSCIEIDDAAYSTANWTNIDVTASFSENCNAQITNIPDANFEQALINLGYDDVIDGGVLTTNIDSITVLDISNKNIADLTGIEDFISLITLNSDDNQLTSIDVTNLTVLEYLYCSNNLINTTIDTSQNLALKRLYCGYNQIISLNVSLNTSLLRLSCYVNQITTLDLSQNALLTSIKVQNNQLTDINVKNGNNLNIVNLNFITINNPNLTCIEVDDAAYSTANWTNIDATASFSENCNAQITNIPDNNFEQALINLGYDDVIDGGVLTANINTITILNLDNNDITDLTGIQDFTALTELYLRNNQLVSIDVSNNLQLSILNFYNNQISNIDLSQNINLTELITVQNPLEALNLTQNNLLTKVNCINNSLTSFDIRNGNNPAISDLNFSLLGNNNLTCVFVDDASWSSTNWTYVPANVTFVNNQTECNSLSINDNLFSSNFSIYPNPAKDTINIQNKSNYPITKIALYDMYGKLVYHSNTVEQIHTNKLSNGLYVIKISSNQKTVSKKIVVSK